MISAYLKIFIFCIYQIYIFGLLSQTQCIEYSRYVYVNEPHPFNNKSVTISKCSIIQIPLIIGGDKAEHDEFPHMAAIGFGWDVSDTNLEWNCGGSLISDLYILTAAHCMIDRERGYAQRVRLGITRISNPESTIQEISVVERIPHPQYERRTKYNDIALLRLQEFVIFNAYIRPACVNWNLDLNWETALATGFGLLTYGDSVRSNKLMKVELGNISRIDCANSYKSNLAMKKGVLDSQFCAGYMIGGKDTCNGDSGGPLQIVTKYPYCMYKIIGITSFGKFCGYSHSPGLYTRVASYIDWIEKHVWADQIE